MGLDAELLARLQFTLHDQLPLHLPAHLHGSGSDAGGHRGMYLRTKDPKWRQLSFFWVKVYGIVFAMGVATGVVQEFEFGMNWADYSRFVGNVFGSLLAAEGVFAFFLEGGFLGLMLFGGNRLGPRMWLFCDLHGRLRRPLQRALDRHGQLLDADPAGLHHRPDAAAGACGHDRLLGGRVHALVHPAPAARWFASVDGGRSAHAQRERVVPAADDGFVDLAISNLNLALPFFILFAVANLSSSGPNRPSR